MSGIGDIVANLSVNSKPWRSGLNQAQGQMSSFVGGIGKMVAPLAGALAAAWGTKQSVAAYKMQLQAQQKLQAVLAATGGAAGLSSTEIANYASELQAVTNYGDEATIAVAGVLATFTNVKGDAFKQTLSLAQDMATVLGGDMQGKATQLGKALNDPIKGISQLAEAGVVFTITEQNMIKSMTAVGDMAGAQGIMLAKLQSQFGGAAKAMADPSTQMMNAVGDVGEMFGSLLLPTINLFSQVVTTGIGYLTPYTDTFKEIGIQGAAAFSVLLDMSKQAISWFFSFFEVTKVGFLSIYEWAKPGLELFMQYHPMVAGLKALFGELFSGIDAGKMTFGEMFVEAAAVLQNIGGLTELLGAKIALFFVSIAGGASHLFTTQLPGYVTWFADNWKDVFFTAVDYGLTALINFGQNIRNMWTAVWEFIKGNGFEFDWTPLTEGARSAIKSLPDIPERVVGQLESELQSDVNRLTVNLGQSIDDSRKQLARSFNSTQDSIAKSFNVNMPTPVAADTTATQQTAKAEPKFAASMLKGSADAMKTIFSSRMGKSPEATATEKLGNIVQQQVGGPLKQIAKNTEPQFAPEFG